MKKLLLICLLSALPAVSAPALAEGVAFVDLDVVYRDSKVINALLEKINAEFRGRENTLREAGEKIKQLQEELKKEDLTLNDEEKRERQNEIVRLDRDFVRDRRALSEDRNLRFQEDRRQWDVEIGKTIEAIAKEKDLDAVFNPFINIPVGNRTFPHNIVFYVNSRVNITNEVIARFDAEAGAKLSVSE